jgi:histidinol-phosphate aminotransferase
MTSGPQGRGADGEAAGERIVAGVGLRRGVRTGDVRIVLGEALAAAGARARDVVALVTVEARQSEPALREMAEILGVPLYALSAELLAGQPVPTPSPRVERAVGTPSVAEAAVLAVGARLVQPRHPARGVTVAIGRLPAGARIAVPAPAPAVPVADLRFHGDAEIGPGLVDLAVNVRATPDWLRAELREGVDELAAYPDPARATAAVAARHGRPAREVLLTAGGAEAFVLLARALTPRRAVVVHPQFTEPEAALVAAGHPVQRVVLAPPFELDPALVPADADLVFVGNPTNPTSVLHPAETLLALARPGRVLVVDEAFMDAVPGEPETLAGTPERPAPAVPGLVVVRSLTKSWGLAGLRIGYLLGDPALLRACREVQPLWSVGSLALRAAVACSGERARAETARAARTAVAETEHFLDAVAGIAGVSPGAPPRAPFVLLRVGGPDPAGVHGRLRAEGWAVRRADTFPGLGPGWLRVTVRTPATSEAFAPALGRAVRGDPPRVIDLRDPLDVPEESHERR